MKKIITSLLLAIIPIIANSQAIHIFHNGIKNPDVVMEYYIDSITIEKTSENKIEQAFYIKGERRGYLLDNIDSLKFNQPYDILAAQREAMIDLYKATNGDKWTNNDNWCTDAPLSDWYGITQLNGQIKALRLGFNKLSGEIPSSFVTLFDTANEILLYGNFLYGIIPSNLRHHSRWQELGWSIIKQENVQPSSGIYTAGFDFNNINLKFPNLNSCFTKPDGTTVSYKDFFSKNKVTIAYVKNSESEADGINVPDPLIDLQLEYEGKGLQTCVAFSSIENKEKWAKWIEYTKKIPSDNFDAIEIGYWGRYSAHNSYLVFDNEGNLLGYLGPIYANFSGLTNHEYEAKQLKEIISPILGDGQEHEEYSSVYYSTDFSKDGEVKILQKATKGCGVDLVLMADMFIDKDMEEGGPYDQIIQKNMEEFFEVEPYKSLRDRFNIYEVKVVSPQNKYTDDFLGLRTEEKKVFEYAQNIPNINKEQLHIAIVYDNEFYWQNSESFAVGGITFTYDDGSFIAFNFDNRRTINHEAGGHGFGYLADEYAWGDDNFSVHEGNCEKLDKDYSDTGWNGNVDWRNDSLNVRWSKFLYNHSYDNEGLGIFEGGLEYFKYGIYRPTYNSLMRNTVETASGTLAVFNAPSRELIYKRIMKLSEGANWEYDFNKFFDFDDLGRQEASENYILWKPLIENGFAGARKRQPSLTHKNNNCKVIKKAGTWKDVLNK